MVTEDPLAVVHYKGKWTWYRSEVDYWVLDSRRWVEAFIREGYDVGPDPYGDRFGIEIVDENNFGSFLAKMDPFKVKIDEVAAELWETYQRNISSWWDVAHLFPQFWLDADLKVLRSVYGDGVELEKYVPPGWRGLYIDFLSASGDSLPEAMQYWKKGKVNLLEHFKGRV
jgi:hypothetical protein